MNTVYSFPEEKDEMNVGLQKKTIVVRIGDITIFMTKNMFLEFSQVINKGVEVISEADCI
jgi:hypothetical protein